MSPIIIAIVTAIAFISFGAAAYATGWANATKTDDEEFLEMHKEIRRLRAQVANLIGTTESSSPRT